MKLGRRIPRTRRASASLLAAMLLTMAPPVAKAAVRIGVHAGANTGTLQYQDPVFSFWNPGWRTFLIGGVDVAVELGDRWSVMTGLRYVRQGNRVTYEVGPTVGEFRLAHDYVAIPALMALRPFPTRRVFIQGGPEFGFLVAARSVIDRTDVMGGVRTDHHEDTNIYDHMETFNLTLDFGVGVEFPVKTHTGFTLARYTHGMIGVAKDDDWLSDWNTQGIETTLGIRW